MSESPHVRFPLVQRDDDEGLVAVEIATGSSRRKAGRAFLFIRHGDQTSVTEEPFFPLPHSRSKDAGRKMSGRSPNHTLGRTRHA